MTLSVTSTTPVYFKDSGAPLVDYTAQLVTISQGQFYLDTATGDFYICHDATSQTALVWHKIPRVDQIASTTRNQSSASRSLNSAFQPSATRDAFVNYSVDIACTLSLVTGQTGTVFLEIATNSAFTTGVQEIGRTVNGNTGTLTIGLNLTQNTTGTVGGFVPAGYYCRLRTDNTVGTPTFTYRSGQEVLM